MTPAPGHGEGGGGGGVHPDRGDPVPFDLAGPLPTGVTLLEASAGTGKTYAIAALVARYVAGVRPSSGCW